MHGREASEGWNKTKQNKTKEITKNRWKKREKAQNQTNAVPNVRHAVKNHCSKHGA
jgi:hypothetical protein